MHTLDRLTFVRTQSVNGLTFGATHFVNWCLPRLREAHFGMLLKPYQQQDVVVEPHQPAQEGFYHLVRLCMCV